MKEFLKDGRFGITSKIRSCSSSVPPNIVEGWGREKQKEFKRFLVIANGSATELEYFLILITDLKIAQQESVDELIEKVN